jgi:hypothetical protein
MSSKSYIIRHSAPSDLDQNPYGTICKVIEHHDDNYDIYLQVSEDEEAPQWELLGSYHQHTVLEYIDNMIDNRLRKNIHYD